MTMTIPANAPAPAEAETISVYEAIGGRAAVTAAVDGLSRSSVRRWAVPGATGDPASPAPTVDCASVTSTLTLSPPTLAPPWTS